MAETLRGAISSNERRPDLSSSVAGLLTLPRGNPVSVSITRPMASDAVEGEALEIYL